MGFIIEDDDVLRWSDQGPSDDLWNWLDLTDWINYTFPGDSLNVNVAPTVTVSPAGITVSPVKVNLSGGTFLGIQVSGGTVGQDYRFEISFALVNGGSLRRPVRLFIADL